MGRLGNSCYPWCPRGATGDRFYWTSLTLTQRLASARKWKMAGTWISTLSQTNPEEITNPPKKRCEAHTSTANPWHREIMFLSNLHTLACRSCILFAKLAPCHFNKESTLRKNGECLRWPEPPQLGVRGPHSLPLRLPYPGDPHGSIQVKLGLKRHRNGRIEI